MTKIVFIEEEKITQDGISVNYATECDGVYVGGSVSFDKEKAMEFYNSFKDMYPNFTRKTILLEHEIK